MVRHLGALMCWAWFGMGEVACRVETPPVTRADRRRGFISRGVPSSRQATLPSRPPLTLGTPASACVRLSTNAIVSAFINVYSHVLGAGASPPLAQVLVTAAEWPLRPRFMDAVAAALDALPQRTPYYPGAAQAHAAFQKKFGEGPAKVGELWLG